MSDIFHAAVDRVSRVPGVRGALIVDLQAAVPVVAELREGVDGTAVAALTATLFQRSTDAAAQGEVGVLRTLQMDAEQGHVLAVSVGELALVVFAEANAQLGLVRLEANRAAESLS